MGAGSRIGFIWIYVLIVLFGVGIIEMLLMPAIQFKLVPTLQQTANATLTPLDAASFAIKTTTTINFMHYALYAVMLVVFIYAIVSIFKKEDYELQT